MHSLQCRLTPVQSEPELKDVILPNNFLGIDYRNQTVVWLVPTREGGGINLPSGRIQVITGGIQLLLDQTVAPNNNIDLYIALDANGNQFFGQNTTPWGNDWSRTNSEAQITPPNAGIALNANAMTLKNQNGTLSCAAGTARYVGCLRWESGGYNMVLKPFQSSGPFGKLGLCSANKRDILVVIHDANGQWADNVDSWIADDSQHGGGNVIWWLDDDGDQQARFYCIEGFQGDGFLTISIDGANPVGFNEGGSLLAIGRESINNITNSIDEATALQCIALQGWHSGQVVAYADGPADSNPVQQTIYGYGSGNHWFEMRIRA